MKNIVILGSTGSIGRNALKVVKSLPGRFNVVGAAASSSVERLVEQASEFQIGTIALLDTAAAWRARNLAPAGVKVLEGVEGLCELASRPDVDLVVCAIVGMAALKPVLAAIDAGHDVAIATKEVLVQKLAAYENTGYEPDEIRAAIEQAAKNSETKTATIMAECIAGAMKDTLEKYGTAGSGKKGETP